jgi:hypothetical protein
MFKRKKTRDNTYLADSISRLIDGNLQSGDYMCSLLSHSEADVCSNLFLNLFDEAMIRKQFDDIGLSEHLNKNGFRDYIIRIGRDSNTVSRLKVYGRSMSPEHLLIEAMFSETLFTPFKAFCDHCEDKKKPCTFQMIVIEWIETNNPEAGFTKGRPQLPGQKKPGLGVLPYLKKFLAAMGKEVSREGFLKIPDHIHTAIMYADVFSFMDPAYQGKLLALRRDMEKYSLSDISWGYLTETIYDRNSGMPEIYHPAEQIFPLSARLSQHFNSKKYTSGVKEAYESKSFIFDYDLMKSLRKSWLKNNKLEDA